jgi:hypothetical protein
VILQLVVRYEREPDQRRRADAKECHEGEPDTTRSAPRGVANVRRGVSKGFMHSCRTLLRGPMTSRLP